MLFRWMFTLALVAIFTTAAAAQRICVLTPDDTDQSRAFATKLEASLSARLKVLDDGLARTAFDSAGLKSPFNLTLDEAKRAGQVMGCEHFLLVRSAVQRRSSFERAEYYEGYAQIFVVSTRSGRLILFSNEKHEPSRPEAARSELEASIPRVAESITKAIRAGEPTASEAQPFPDIPDAGTRAAAGFRAPIPYRRMKPEYTAEASLYDITATVDILVSLDAEGAVQRTEITRWAGYGLDESVERAIRGMNWRPAERDGKFVPARFLVRYNFKKADK